MNKTRFEELRRKAKMELNKQKLKRQDQERQKDEKKVPPAILLLNMPVLDVCFTSDEVCFLLVCLLN
jgi:hypothetical protein